MLIRATTSGGSPAVAAMLLVAMSWGNSAHAVITGASYVTNAGGAVLFATPAPGQDDRLYLAGREGQISILDLTTNQIDPTPFLQIPDVDAAGEGGLLGLAFHPDYETNGKFYTYVTVDNGGVPIDGGTSPFSSRIREYTRSATDPDVATPDATEVLSWAQPRNNHNGGWIGFNPNLDGSTEQHLYITSGDGGKQGDPDNNAQTLTNDLLGKVLRIDINGDDFPEDANRNYAIPADNPFADATGDDEIWSYGLRNPYRASFDRESGDLWIADVGQGRREEINRQPADSAGGENYAWSRREGRIAYQGGASLPGDTDPVYDYEHGGGTFRGNSVTGGNVYRGDDASLNGEYLFADFASSNFWAFDPADPDGTVRNLNSTLFGNGPRAGSPVAFGEDAMGSLFIFTIGGDIWRIDTTSPGDYDGNGLIDADDLAAWSSTYGSTENLAADGNGDGAIDAADYTVWRDAFNSQPSSGVPEPSTLWISLLASAMAWSMRRPPVKE